MPITNDQQPVPDRPDADLRQLRRAAHRREQRGHLHRSRLVTRRVCISTRWTCSGSCPGDMSIGLTYMGASGRHLTWGGTAAGIGQHQPGRSEIPAAQQRQRRECADADSCRIRSSASRAPGRLRRARRSQRNQLLRPFPQFDNVNMIYSTLAQSQYHAGVIAITKRATGWWGGRISYTYSRLQDNQFAQGNYYSSAPGILNNYTADPGVGILQSGCRVRPQPAGFAAQAGGEPRSSGCRSVKEGAGSPMASATCWRAAGPISFVIQMQSGFPIGVSQNTNNTNLLGRRPAAEHRAGCGLQRAGQHHRSAEGQPGRQPLPQSERLHAGAGGHVRQCAAHPAGRVFAVAKLDRHGGQQGLRSGRHAAHAVRLEVINLFNNPWYVALESTAPATRTSDA